MSGVSVPAVAARGRVEALRLSRLLPSRNFIAGLVLLGGVVVMATSIGTVRIAPGTTARVIASHLHLPAGEVERGSAEDRIVWQVRLPRVLTATVVGASLALAGASYQAVFRNPLADPFLLGVAAGAALGATAAIVSPVPLDYYRFGTVGLGAFLGAMLAVLITYQLARAGWAVPATAHVLAGVAVSAGASAATSFLMMMSEERLPLIFSWLYGDFTSASWTKLSSVLPYVTLTSLALLALSRQLNVLQLSEDEARSLGVRVELVKAVVILLASLITAVCVAITGLIGFVGLIVPHICRLLFGPDYRVLLPTAMAGGAIFLILADLGARTLLSPQEIPVGILTAAIGAPFFLFLLRRHTGSIG